MINLAGMNIVIGEKVIQYWIDGQEADDYSIKLWGWAIIVDIPSWQLDLRFDFKGAKHSFSCKPSAVWRNDVTVINGKGIVNHDWSGFLIEIPRQHIGEDNYNIEFNFRKADTGEQILTYPFIGVKVH